MRSIQVHFPSGREVLSSYWGFLHQGGLVLREAEDLSEGDDVVLDVRIKSLKPRAFVEFAGGQDQEVMLNAAWADSHDVPQRKHRRYPVGGREVRYAAADAPDKLACGHLLNVSPGGCRLKGATVLPKGARVQLNAQGLYLEGQVRWSSPAGEMGIEFSRPDLVIQALLDQAV